MKKGGVSTVEEGLDTGTRLTCCSIRSVHQEEIQLLKKDRNMNNISRALGVKLNPCPVNNRKLTEKDRTQSCVRSQCIGCV